MRVSIVVPVGIVVFVACAGGVPATTTEFGPTTSPMASQLTTTSDIGESSTTVSSTTTDSSTPTTILDLDFEITGGRVASGPERVEVALGEDVDIRILSDTDAEVHVHGYDLILDLEAGVPFHLRFAADIPGIFEVELHPDDSLLFELEVTG